MNRLYWDIGTDENAPWLWGDYWQTPWSGYNGLLEQGYAHGVDLKVVVGCGDAHNEAAWEARFPEALRWMLPIQSEANLLEEREYGITLEEPNLLNNSITVDIPTRRGVQYELQMKPNLNAGNWITVAEPVKEVLQWNTQTLSHTNATLLQEKGFYRVKASDEP